MTAQILDGKSLADQLQAEIRDRVAQFTARTAVTPCLAAVLVGDNRASEVYVRNKRRSCDAAGLRSELHRLTGTASESDVLALVQKLNERPDIHGILVQLPLPPGIRAHRILDAIHPLKDVDAFHPENAGRLMQGRPRFIPCTPHGVQQLLHRNSVPVSGRHVVIVGRSEIVGKPLALLLCQRSSPLGTTAANGTVTIAHSQTASLAQVTRQADILVAAIGQPRFITRDMVKPGAAVIDVGINRTDQGLAGDVDFEAVREVAGHITPVPGGVGPLTVTMLLQSTLNAAEWLTNGEPNDGSGQ